MVDPAGRTDTPGEQHGSKLATLLYLAGLGADVGTTAYGLHKGTLEEANPLTSWAGKTGIGPPLVAGAGGIGVLLLARKLQHNHPALANALLTGMGAAHSAAAISNVHQMHKADSKSAAPAAATAPHPGMVQAPDGSWYDPNFLTVK